MPGTALKALLSHLILTMACFILPLLQMRTLKHKRGPKNYFVCGRAGKQILGLSDSRPRDVYDSILAHLVKGGDPCKTIL